VVAVAALHEALHRPGAMVLIVSPSLRQSQETFPIVMHSDGVRYRRDVGGGEPERSISEQAPKAFKRTPRETPFSQRSEALLYSQAATINAAVDSLPRHALTRIS
jgi:hypothetical protein